SESAKNLFLWSNNVVKFMESYIEKKAKDDGHTGPIFLIHARGGNTEARWKRFRDAADPLKKIGSDIEPSKETVFFGCSGVFVKIFSTQSPSRQYVYTAYAFFAFWLILTIYLVINFPGFYIDIGFRR